VNGVDPRRHRVVNADIPAIGLLGHRGSNSDIPQFRRNVLPFQLGDFFGPDSGKSHERERSLAPIAKPVDLPFLGWVVDASGKQALEFFRCVNGHFVVGFLGAHHHHFFCGILGDEFQLYEIAHHAGNVSPAVFPCGRAGRVFVQRLLDVVGADVVAIHIHEPFRQLLFHLLIRCQRGGAVVLAVGDGVSPRLSHGRGPGSLVMVGDVEHRRLCQRHVVAHK